MRPKRRRHDKPNHCGFCGCEITAHEKRENGDVCWICQRNREDKAAVNRDEDEDDQ